MAVPDQFLDLAHATAEMVPAAAPHPALHGLVAQQTIADFDRRDIPCERVRMSGFFRRLCRSSPFLLKTIHRFSFVDRPEPNRSIVKEGEGVMLALFSVVLQIVETEMQRGRAARQAIATGGLCRSASKRPHRFLLAGCRVMIAH
ncbi:UNVERIFIED_ORG: hypothetical protein GGD48_000626 [Rhizobium etli]